jgi:hypothetical protein
VRIKVFFLPLVIVSLISFNSFSQKWNLRADKDGIKVYTRGIESSNFQEFKAEVIVKSNLSGVLMLLDSISEYPKWMKNCSFAERLKKISKGSGYSYYIIKAPWPVSDRDACVYFKMNQDTSTKIVTITLKGIKDFSPIKSGYVRVPSLNGFWQLTPLSKGITKVVYQVHCDIGGYIPAAIVNAYITEAPLYNLSNLKKIVESPLFPKAIWGNVKELK